MIALDCDDKSMTYGCSNYRCLFLCRMIHNIPSQCGVCSSKKVYIRSTKIRQSKLPDEIAQVYDLRRHHQECSECGKRISYDSKSHSLHLPLSKAVEDFSLRATLKL